MIKHLKQWWGWFITPQTRIKVLENYVNGDLSTTRYKPQVKIFLVWIDLCSWFTDFEESAQKEIDKFWKDWNTKYKTKTTYIKYP